jgi:hypothetical protein
MPRDHDYGVIVVSVQSHQFEKAVADLGGYIGGATVLVLSNLWALLAGSIRQVVTAKRPYLQGSNGYTQRAAASILTSCTAASTVDELIEVLCSGTRKGRISAWWVPRRTTAGIRPQHDRTSPSRLDRRYPARSANSTTATPYRRFRPSRSGEA